MNFQPPEDPAAEEAAREAQAEAHWEKQLTDAYAAGRKDEREAIALRVEAITAGMWSCDMNGSAVDAYIPKWKAIQAVEES